MTILHTEKVTHVSHNKVTISWSKYNYQCNAPPPEVVQNPLFSCKKSWYQLLITSHTLLARLMGQNIDRCILLMISIWLLLLLL